MAPFPTGGEVELEPEGSGDGGSFHFSHVGELHRTVMEHVMVSTPPLCLYRRSLWGACQHFSRNLPDVGRTGRCVSFCDNAEKAHIPAWLGFNVTKPSTVEFPPSLIKQITGGGELNAMLSGVSPATRKRYLSAWNQWAYIVSMRGRPTWLPKTGPNWDADLVDFTMFETHVAKHTSDTMRAEISAIRFWRIIFGVDYFAQYRGRYHQVLKGLKRDHKAQRKTPFSLDMIDWLCDNYLRNYSADTSRVELYTATAFGFSSSLELGNWGEIAYVRHTIRTGRR